MILIVAVDDNKGLTFNHRRQSQDSILREHILHLCGEKPLWVNAYTARQFSPEQAEKLHISEDFLAEAQTGDFCFLENCSALPYADKIEQVILYKWNRRYPADLSFDIPLTESEWILESTEDFVGSSHEKITKEVYRHEIYQA